MKPEEKALRRAIKAAGNKSALARLLGCTRQCVSGWKRVPLVRVVAVEKATGVPRAELRPDVWDF